MVSIGVFDSGAWGIALAILLSNEGITATLTETLFPLSHHLDGHPKTVATA